MEGHNFIEICFVSCNAVDKVQAIHQAPLMMPCTSTEIVITDRAGVACPTYNFSLAVKNVNRRYCDSFVKRDEAKHHLVRIISQTLEGHRIHLNLNQRFITKSNVRSEKKAIIHMHT